MKLSPFLLASVLSASVAWGAIDFFGLPEKFVVPKSVTAPPAPAPSIPVPPPPTVATPRPVPQPPTEEEPPTLIPDGAFLKTPSVGNENPSARGFYDVGPNQGVLIGFQYTIGQNPLGGSSVESLTPLYVRSSGKAMGITRGPRGEKPATVLEARPGYAVGRVDLRGGSVIEAMAVVFMRYENGALHSSDSYRSNNIGANGAQEAQATVRLRTDTRPFVGMYGKASNGINELGLLVRKEATAPVVPPRFPPTPPTPPGGTEVVNFPPSTPRATAPPVAPPAAPLPPGSIQVFASANERYTLYLNGREILSGNNSHEVQSGNFLIVKGDVFCAVVKDSSTNNPWFSLRVVRDDTTILDAGDMLYQTTEPPLWKTSRLTSGFREPRITTHAWKQMGTDSRPRAARPSPKGSTATTLYLKGVVQQ